MLDVIWRKLVPLVANSEHLDEKQKQHIELQKKKTIILKVDKIKNKNKEREQQEQLQVAGEASSETRDGYIH